VGVFLFKWVFSYSGAGRGSGVVAAHVSAPVLDTRAEVLDTG